MGRVMGANELESIPMAAYFAEPRSEPERLPLWFVPPELRRSEWSEPGPEALLG